MNSRPPNLRSVSPVVLFCFSALMSTGLAVLLLTACATQNEASDPPSEARSSSKPSQGDAHGAGLMSFSVAHVVAADSISMPEDRSWNRERYDHEPERGFLRPTDSPLSTFSIDVDTAAYANVRRFLKEGQRPPERAVRVEELVNYFRYPRRLSSAEAGGEPFEVDLEIFDAPWRAEHRLVRISIEGRDLPASDVPPRNLVFLLDVSGSMEGPDRLDLVKAGLSDLVATLRPIDRVSIVVYAGASGLVLPPTRGDDRSAILAALDRLSAGGSTAGASGIQLAYSPTRPLEPISIRRGSIASSWLPTATSMSVRRAARS